jgi:OOP family OmpA-OmpF porin
MKKITLLLICSFIGLSMNAQEQEGEKEKMNYNQWSIDFGAGLNKASRPFTDGYYSPTFGAWNADLGVRYMFNDKAGMRLNLGLNNISEGEDVPEFTTQYLRATLEGVLNLGSILNFREWTNTFNLLAHGGGGVARLSTDEDVFYGDEDEYMGVVTAGLTPQVKLGNSVALYADLSIYGNINQDFTWDGNTRTDDIGFDGLLTNVSVGVNLYLGNNKVHADWVDVTEKTELRNKLDSVQDRVAQLENNLMDEDQDGVPNYRDREPNTMNGVAVDTKGVAVDKNENGIPDEIESSLDKRYTSKEEMKNNKQSGSGVGVEQLLNDGYVNVYFQFNSDKPETYSLEAINYLITYMQNNPNSKAELIGYSDEIGNAAYNKDLSERRAKRVHDIIVASGVDSSRLEHRGEGVDDSVDKSSTEARQIVRRVTFKLK